MYIHRGTPTRAMDEEILKMLDLRANDGLSAAKIGARFGLSKNAVVGKLHRVKTEEIHDCACVKPENRDGGMPRWWWK